MKLIANKESKYLVVGLTDEAISYIEEERKKVDDRHWTFGKIVNGCCFVDVSPQEDKCEPVRLISRLLDMGMETSELFRIMFGYWKVEALFAERQAELQRKIRALEETKNQMGRITQNGCDSCRSLEVIQKGDDETGYCSFCGQKVNDQTVYRLKAGEPFMKNRYMPARGCKYLN